MLTEPVVKLQMVKIQEIQIKQKVIQDTEKVRGTWVKVFMIIPEFRILGLTFFGKSASKCWIRQIIIAFLIYVKII